MSRNVSNPQQRAALPVSQRVSRIRHLELLAARVADELLTERAALNRILNGRPATTASAAQVPTGPAPARIREWARTNGVEVAGRGRLPLDVVAAFDTAHPGEQAGPRPLVASRVREWARDNGHPVAGRGSISASLMAAFAAAHPSEVEP